MSYHNVILWVSNTGNGALLKGIGTNTDERGMNDFLLVTN